MDKNLKNNILATSARLDEYRDDFAAELMSVPLLGHDPLRGSIRTPSMPGSIRRAGAVSTLAGASVYNGLPVGGLSELVSSPRVSSLLALPKPSWTAPVVSTTPASRPVLKAFGGGTAPAASSALRTPRPRVSAKAAERAALRLPSRGESATSAALRLPARRHPMMGAPHVGAPTPRAASRAGGFLSNMSGRKKAVLGGLALLGGGVFMSRRTKNEQ